MSDGLSESHLKIISYETTKNARGPTKTKKYEIAKHAGMERWIAATVQAASRMF